MPAQDVPEDTALKTVLGRDSREIFRGMPDAARPTNTVKHSPVQLGVQAYRKLMAEGCPRKMTGCDSVRREHLICWI